MAGSFDESDLEKYAVADSFSPSLTRQEFETFHPLVNKAGFSFPDFFGGGPPEEIKDLLERIPLYHELDAIDEYDLEFEIDGDEVRRMNPNALAMFLSPKSIEEDLEGRIVVLPLEEVPDDLKYEYESTIYHELIHAKQYYDSWKFAHRVEGHIPQWKAYLYYLKDEEGGKTGEEVEAHYKQIIYLDERGNEISPGLLSGYFVFSES